MLQAINSIRGPPLCEFLERETDKQTNKEIYDQIQIFFLECSVQSVQYEVYCVVQCSVQSLVCTSMCGSVILVIVVIQNIPSSICQKLSRATCIIYTHWQYCIVQAALYKLHCVKLHIKLANRDRKEHELSQMLSYERVLIIHNALLPL